MGFCGIYASEEIGGLGLPRLDATLVFEEMAAVDPSTTAFLTRQHGHLDGGPLGQPALREEWGPQLASGEKLASYCLTEPGAGSDAASLSTRAQRQGGDYIVNGAKAFISGGGDTNLLIVMARTGGEGAAGISAFAIPADSAGISYGRKEEKMGWNSQSTRPIVRERARAGRQSAGQRGHGFKIAMKAGRRSHQHRHLLGRRPRARWTRPGATWTSAASSTAAWRNSRRCIRWPTWPPISWPRARCRSLAARAGRRRAPRATYCAMGWSAFATDMGFQICLDAQQIHGGYGYLRDYPLSVCVRYSAYIRFWRDE